MGVHPRPRRHARHRLPGVRHQEARGHEAHLQVSAVDEGHTAIKPDLLQRRIIIHQGPDRQPQQDEHRIQATRTCNHKEQATR